MADRNLAHQPPPGPSSTENRRGHLRFPTEPFLQCQLAPFDDSRILWSRLMDLSQTKIGLLVGAPLEVGARLRMRLTRITGGWGCRLDVEVIHVALETEGHYRIGARLIPALPDEVFEDLLRWHLSEGWVLSAPES